MTPTTAASVVLRPAESDDVPAIAEVFRASREAAMPWLPALHTPDEDLAFFGGQVREHAAYVAELDGRLVGFAVVDEATHELDHLYLAPDVRRRGIGRALLDHARARHDGPLELWAFAGNRAARDFYAVCGAVELFETDGSGNEERMPDVRLELPAFRRDTVDRPGDRDVDPQVDQ